MRVIYIADDGTQFDDEFECEHYEWILNHPYLKDIHCYDKDSKELTDIMSEDTYSYTMRIEVPTDEAAKELREVGRYCGFCAYEDVDNAGTWVWEEPDHLNGHFVKVGEKYE